MSGYGKRGNNNDNSFNKRQRHHNETVLRIIIPNRCAGGVIGKGGENVVSIREVCPQANVSIKDCPSAAERIIHVDCKADELGTIAEMIIPLIYKSFSSGDHEVGIAEHEASVLFADGVVGGIIGKGGSSINSLRSDSGAKIKAFSKKLENSEERIVLVKGSEQSVVQALKLIYERCDLDSKPYKYYDPMDAMIYPRDPGAGGYCDTEGDNMLGGGNKSAPQQNYGRPPAPHQFPPPARGFDAPPSSFGSAAPAADGLFSQFIAKFPFKSYSAPDGGQFVVKEVTLENNLTGCVIGDRGSRIRDVRTTSAANVKIGDPDSAGPGERLITIQGTNAACHMAEYMLQCCVQTFSEVYQNYTKQPQRTKLEANPGGNNQPWNTSYT